MFKHIAVGLDGSTHAAAAEDLALALAHRLGAALHGVHVIDAAYLEGAFITDISGALGFEPFVNLQAQTRATLEDLAGVIEGRFRERCAAVGVTADIVVVRAGVVSGLLAGSARADLLVVGQRGVNARFHEDLLGPNTCALLRRSNVPVLVVPESCSLPRHPLVAFDGSPKSLRALHHAAELCLALGTPLSVVTVDDDGERARARLSEAAAHLKPFGIEQVELRHEQGEAVEQVLAAQLEPGDFDLLCLGSHGHNRVVELVLGSTSEYLARRSSVPVLCATRA